MREESLAKILELRQWELLKWSLHGVSNKFNLLSLELEDLEDMSDSDQEAFKSLLASIETRRNQFNQVLQQNKDLFSPNNQLTRSETYQWVKDLFQRRLQDIGLESLEIKIKDPEKEVPFYENLNKCWLFFYVLIHSESLKNLNDMNSLITNLPCDEGLKADLKRELIPWHESFFC